MFGPSVYKICIICKLPPLQTSNLYNLMLKIQWLLLIFFGLMNYCWFSRALLVACDACRVRCLSRAPVKSRCGSPAWSRVAERVLTRLIVVRALVLGIILGGIWSRVVIIGGLSWWEIEGNWFWNYLDFLGLGRNFFHSKAVIKNRFVLAHHLHRHHHHHHYPYKQIQPQPINFKIQFSQTTSNPLNCPTSIQISTIPTAKTTAHLCQNQIHPPPLTCLISEARKRRMKWKWKRLKWNKRKGKRKNFWKEWRLVGSRSCRIRMAMGKIRVQILMLFIPVGKGVWR